jgi:asparagine synthase (glutamine-hydrolysing)
MGIELQNRLVDFILTRADKMSMANSLELRTPFLDYRLIEFSRRVPAEWKVDRHGEKRILREAFTDFLPPALRNRPKQRVPVAVSVVAAAHGDAPVAR